MSRVVPDDLKRFLMQKTWLFPRGDVVHPEVVFTQLKHVAHAYPNSLMSQAIAPWFAPFRNL